MVNFWKRVELSTNISYHLPAASENPAENSHDFPLIGNKQTIDSRLERRFCLLHPQRTKMSVMNDAN